MRRRDGCDEDMTHGFCKPLFLSKCFGTRTGRANEGDHEKNLSLVTSSEVLNLLSGLLQLAELKIWAKTKTLSTRAATLI